MRNYGNGSVYQRHDGRWIAAVELPRAPGEKRARRVFSAATRERVQERLATYLAANPPRGASVNSGGRRPNLARARELGTHTPTEWRAYGDALGWVCEYCGVQTYIFSKRGYTTGDRRTTKDHRTPVAAGGSDALSNLAVSCKRCNREKGLMDEATFRATRQARA